MEQIPHHPPSPHTTHSSATHVPAPAPQEELPSENIVVSARFLKILGGLFFVVVLFGGALTYFKAKLDDIPKNYEECVKRTGSRLQKSQPDICITLEGNYFIQPLTDHNGNPIIIIPTPIVDEPSPTPDPLLIAPSPTSSDLLSCKRVGCSGQLCLDINSEDVITTCEFRAEYACYQEAPCERQPDGLCGFTPSLALTTCLQEKQTTVGF